MEENGTTAAVLGLDVGKASHWACGIDPAGRVVLSERVANRAADVDALLARAGSGALVVVDQKRNIGALVVARARAAGNPVAYLPGSAEKALRDAEAGVAKTDRIDAEVIARAALGMPHTLRPLAEEAPRAAAARLLASQLDFCTRSRTQAKNRLRAVLLEADPALEAAVEPSSAWQMAVFAEIGGPGEVAAAGLRRFRAVAERAHGAARAASAALWEAAAGAAATATEAGDALVRMLARDILALGAEMEELQSLMAAELGDDETYRCLLTVPGIGPKTAAALVAAVDISLFPSCDKLASYCGVAPADSQSGTSVRSTRPQRGGSKPLKNLLIFSCNSLVGTKNRFGRYYDECRARKMRHNAALKAVARKRLRVIYSIMRDPRPYKEPGA
ncbi:IS110 family transposase [Adlercreutzia sp. R25]|uniref:IS110 family transposase n=1 Tax=Adlercreutzia shanghongiae TaxID=3111773 RepID=A0ABU6IY92_9ACTN|nr:MULTISPECIES: IS110 family transposase [unclassified Adlercreutzia]MEC4271814.1 IS110 family transposase [Adlercreutzia sp. R25]MEC4294821.1 IS110 family transposase [Adlercreutzia sp. R22]